MPIKGVERAKMFNKFSRFSWLGIAQASLALPSLLKTLV